MTHPVKTVHNFLEIVMNHSKASGLDLDESLRMTVQYLQSENKFTVMQTQLSLRLLDVDITKIVS